MNNSSTLIGEGKDTWKDFLSSREVEEMFSDANKVEYGESKIGNYFQRMN
jgi:hypothetical protein